MSSKDKNETILSRKRDWERWLRPIKCKAFGAEIWDYINPDANDSNSKELIEPEIPKRLEGENDGDLEYRRELYRREIKKYDDTRADIRAIREHIYRTIDQSAFIFIQDKSNVREILNELQKRYKPDPYWEQFYIINKRN